MTLSSLMVLVLVSGGKKSVVVPLLPLLLLTKYGLPVSLKESFHDPDLMGGFWTVSPEHPEVVV